MLEILIRYDMKYPKEGVELFVSHLVHETLAVRKVSLILIFFLKNIDMHLLEYSCVIINILD